MLMIVVIKIKICLVTFVAFLQLAATETGTKYTVTRRASLVLIKDYMKKDCTQTMNIDELNNSKKYQTPTPADILYGAWPKHLVFFVESDKAIRLLMSTH